jgi:hypothetical protein
MIDPELEAILRQRAEAAGIAVETYIERIALDDLAAEEELESLAIAGLNSGEPIEADDEYWKEKRDRLINRQRKIGAG